MKDTLEFILWTTFILLLVFMFDGNPDVWDLLLKVAKDKLQ